MTAIVLRPRFHPRVRSLKKRGQARTCYDLVFAHRGGGLSTLLRTGLSRSSHDTAMIAARLLIKKRSHFAGQKHTISDRNKKNNSDQRSQQKAIAISDRNKKIATNNSSDQRSLMYHNRQDSDQRSLMYHHLCSHVFHRFEYMQLFLAQGVQLNLTFCRAIVHPSELIPMCACW